MPLPLGDAEKDLLLTLAAPIEQRRRGEFLQEVVQKLEASAQGGIGVGVVHRIGRVVQRDFRDIPPDLRQGRLGPRGPRS
jgi:hypothetical protein